MDAENLKKMIDEMVDDYMDRANEIVSAKLLRKLLFKSYDERSPEEIQEIYKTFKSA